jgi:protoporphyrinogen/coproporphyrinogen III oxidase
VPQKQTRPQVVVVGGGIAGAAAAWFLTRNAGAPSVTVVEGSSDIGGKLRVGEVAGVTTDLGAESMLVRRPEAVALARAVGLADRLVSPSTTAASIWSRGVLRPLPVRTVMGVPADLAALAASGVLSWTGLARVPLDHLLPAEPLVDDVTVGAYVESRVGREVVDRLVEPLLGGVYAGSADRLSLIATLPQLAEIAREGKPLLRGAAGIQAVAGQQGEVFNGLVGGVGQLPTAVLDASGATVRTATTARELCRTSAGWRVTVGSTRTPEHIDADAVVLAVPARPAARLLRQEVPVAAAELDDIDYASVAVITLAYRRSTLHGRMRGSGFLVPPVERRLIKAATFSSSKWAWVNASAPDLELVRCSIGRYGEEEDLQRDDDELIAAVADEFADATGAPENPIDSRVTRWGGALPQYAVGHNERISRVLAAVDAAPGLAVCGAAYDGVGIPACIAGAESAALRILQHLRAAEQ